MLETHARITRALDAEMRAEHGLPVSSYEVLMFLGDAPERRLRMAEIADRVLLSRSGLTRLVDRLEALGYVTRCAVEDDGRGAYAELTDAGWTKLQARTPDPPRRRAPPVPVPAVRRAAGGARGGLGQPGVTSASVRGHRGLL